MIYQNIVVLTPDTVYYPDGTGEGFDRLSFSFPYPGLDEERQKWIDAGAVDRYFGPHDSVTYYPDRIVSKIAWKTRQAADITAAHLREKPVVMSVETVEISE
jgi:hypothetical protein